MRIALVSLLASVLALVLVSLAPEADAQVPAISVPAPRPSAGDPALIRRQLLARFDRRIDEMAAQCRLEVRLALNEVCPIPYLGVDTEVVPNGLRLTAVYPDTGAARCGLLVGDVLRKVADKVVDTKAALGQTVRSSRVGELVEIEIERASRPMKLSAVLGPRPEEDEDEDEQFPDLVEEPKPPPAPVTFDFEGGPETAGTLPAAFQAVLGGHGRPPVWQIERSAGTSALRQVDADKTGIHFPMVVLRDWSAVDAIGRVRFRYVGGQVDRAAGIVLRYRDPANYIVARANAAESDLRIFRVVNGDRRTLPGAVVKCPTDDDQWHTLEFRAEGPKLTAVLDGKAEAIAYDTYFLRGLAGLWTKSDSITEFDDLHFAAQK